MPEKVDFKESFESAPYEDPRVDKLVDDIERLKQESTQIENGEKKPSNSEIMEVYRYATSDVRLDIAKRILKSPFGSNVLSLEAGDRKDKERPTEVVDELLDLSKIEYEELPDEELNFADLDVSKGPKVFIKKITQKRDTRSDAQKISDRKKGITGPVLTEVDTGQLRIAVIYNNGNTNETNTVAMATLERHPLADNLVSLNNGVFRVTDLNGFNESFATHVNSSGEEVYRNNSISNKLARGELTYQQYLKAYERSNGMSLMDSWSTYDGQIRLAASQGSEKHVKAIEKSEDIRKRLDNEYTDMLEQIQIEILELESALLDLRQEIWTRWFEILGRDEFQSLFVLASQGIPSGIFRSFFINHFDISENQLKYLESYFTDILEQNTSITSKTQNLIRRGLSNLKGIFSRK